MHQHGGEIAVGAVMAKLNQADRAIAALVQLDGKIAQDPVRILVLLIDQSREVALGVEHGISESRCILHISRLELRSYCRH